jgi:hypothetical protein
MVQGTSHFSAPIFSLAPAASLLSRGYNVVKQLDSIEAMK